MRLPTGSLRSVRIGPPRSPKIGPGGLLRIGPRRRWVTAAAAGALLIGGAAVAVRAPGYSAASVRAFTGQAWLASPGVGQLALLDGSTGDVVVRVGLAGLVGKGAQLVTAQAGADAVVADRSRGALVRVRGATLSSSPGAVRPLPDAASAINVLAGPKRIHAVDVAGSVAVALDPLTMRMLGRPVPLGAGTDARSLVVDAGDRLWSLDPQTGDLIWLDGGRRHQRRGAASATIAPLVLAGGRPVIIDPAKGAATLIDPASGDATASCELPLPAGQPVTFGGSGGGLVTAAVGVRGVLLLADLDGGDDGCAGAVPLGSGADRLGTPVEAAGRIFVPDLTTGTVLVVDPAAQRVLARPRVLVRPSAGLELTSRDGVVFFNDVAGEAAGVIRLDGSVVKARKYDPARPEDGLVKPQEVDRPAPPQPQPTPTAKPTPQPARPRPKPDVVRGGGAGLSIASSVAVAGNEVALLVTTSDGSRVASANWSFGDSGGGSGPLVYHTWSAAGTYPVTVTVRTADGRTLTGTARLPVSRSSVPGGGTGGTGGTGTGTGGTTPPPTVPPTTPGGTRPQVPPLTASVSAGPVLVTAGEQVRAHATASGGTLPFAWTVNWGDGTSTTWTDGTLPADVTCPAIDGEPPTCDATHVYGGVGSYPVTLTVTDGANRTATATSEPAVEVVGVLSTSAEVDDDSVYVGSTVSLWSRSAGGVTGFSLEIAWGDGTVDALNFNTMAERGATHAYRQTCSCDIVVTARDARGTAATATVPVRVGEPPSLRINGPWGVEALRPATVDVVTSGGIDPLTIRYDWGDGTTGDADSRTHTYTEPGSYRLTVTATDPATGARDTATSAVDANEPSLIGRQSATLSPDDSIDLDLGGGSPDLQFVGDQNLGTIQAVNGTGFAEVSDMSWSACHSAAGRMGGQAKPTSALREGDILCFRTTSGNYAAVKFGNGAGDAKPDRINIAIRTWPAP